jgi:hypothetical protein
MKAPISLQQKAKHRLAAFDTDKSRERCDRSQVDPGELNNQNLLIVRPS